MNQLRFSLRTFALIIAFIAGGLWWVFWPSKVADQVCELLNDGDFDEVSQLVATSSDREFLDYLAYITRDIPKSDGKALSTTPRERTWAEILRGRQQFILGFHFEIVVERGSVSFPGSEDFRGDLEQQKERDQLEKEYYERQRHRSAD